MDKAVELLQEAGVKRLIPLNDQTFHTALLKPASDLLAVALENVTFLTSKFPVGNTEASVMEKERIKELLTRQGWEPVRFR